MSERCSNTATEYFIKTSCKICFIVRDEWIKKSNEKSIIFANVCFSKFLFLKWKEYQYILKTMFKKKYKKN